MASALRPGMGPRSFLETVERYPVTFGTCALAIAATATWHTGGNVEAYVLDDHLWDGQVWRIVTCVFPHVSIFHLFFNLYWTWRFGLFVEEFYRWKGTLGFFLLFAAFSSTASYAAGEHGVGLSGVGYGLFGMLWIMSRRDSRLRGALDTGTIYIFVAWFFLCILLTWAGVWRVGNVAHGAGAVMGIAAGYGFADLVRGWRRGAARIALAAGVLLAAGGAALRSPPADFFGSHTGFLFAQGYRAAQVEDDERAARYLRKALERDGDSAHAWAVLGGVLGRLGRDAEQLRAYEVAVALVESRGTMHDEFDPGLAFPVFKTVGLAEEGKGHAARALRFLEAASDARARPLWGSSGPIHLDPDPEVEAALARLREDPARQ